MRRGRERVLRRIERTTGHWWGVEKGSNYLTGTTIVPAPPSYRFRFSLITTQL